MKVLLWIVALALVGCAQEIEPIEGCKIEAWVVTAQPRICFVPRSVCWKDDVEAYYDAAQSCHKDKYMGLKFY